MELITQDRRMQELIQLARTVAQSRATVLIQGESGTGKELMACMIHESSPRAAKPFVAINCAAIPEALLESELFGHERGSFTGATSSKAGKFELASGGTILLDEISEMDIRLQAKLLRVIQEGEVDRIGGRRPIPVDARIIATTNRNLAERARAGGFREDLYYRLNVVNLLIPPLRERLGDIAVLANQLISSIARKNGRQIGGLSREAMEKLNGHRWPGNVRELENVIERAVITATGAVVQSRDLMIGQSGALEDRSAQASGVPRQEEAQLEREDLKSWVPGATLDDIERNVIIQALKFHHGNRTHTAKALGISIRTLRNKLADYRKVGIYL